MLTHKCIWAYCWMLHHVGFLRFHLWPDFCCMYYIEIVIIYVLPIACAENQTKQTHKITQGKSFRLFFQFFCFSLLIMRHGNSTTVSAFLTWKYGWCFLSNRKHWKRANNLYLESSSCRTLAEMRNFCYFSDTILFSFTKWFYKWQR